VKAQEPSVLEAFREPRRRMVWAVALGGLAMLLILLSELWPAGTSAASQAQDSGEAAAAYQEQLEQRLAALISQIDGAGQTVVMVTLETGEETVYAVDTLSGQTQSQETHVLLEDGTALEQTVRLPEVCGAAIICDGGGDVRIVARITELVSALLDIPSNRICVEARKQE